MKLADQLVTQLTTARKWTRDLIADIDESTWFTPPAPGLGHVAWQLGHVAGSQIMLVHVRCCGKSFEDCAPAAYKDMFTRGSTPVADAKAYPPIAEIRAFFDRMQTQTLGLISAMSDEQLGKPTHGEPHPMFANCGGACAMAAMHETFHGGQVAMIRRLAGKKPLR